ncbi:fish-egg lectin-like isoform X2 [Narcine bancroftii]
MVVMERCLLLLLLAVGSTEGNRCTDVDGVLNQIDAGNGMVFGVNATGSVYTRLGNSWTLLPGNLKHVTVGTAGVWGVGDSLEVYRLVAGSWSPVPAPPLVQVDAGSQRFVSGVDQFGSTHCLGWPLSEPSPAWDTVASRLRYVSCGPLGCWGVSLANGVYHRLNVRPRSCIGTSWVRVTGQMLMVEVGTDGRVFGVSITQDLYMRKGLTPEKPIGWGWTKIQIGNLRFKHVSWDLGQLWLLTDSGRIVRCSGSDVD